MKRILSLVLTAIMAFSLSVTSFADNGTALVSGHTLTDVEYEFAFAVHSISDNRYIRHVGPDTSADTLHADECYLIYMTLHNNTGRALEISKLELLIDKQSFIWKNKTVKNAYSVYLSRNTMSQISPGKHTCTVKLNGQRVHSNVFMMPRDWGARMTLPTSGQLSSHDGSQRSPYISYYTYFPSGNGLTQYSIDVRTDHQPTGTYLCPINWWMDLSNLRERYEDIWADYGSPGGGYCGLQVWNDGTKGVIMTLWKVFCRDRYGNVTVVTPKVVYPLDGKIANTTESTEGSFVHCSYPYDWKAGKDYRILLQTSKGDNGNTFLTLYIQDLDNSKWTELFCFDTGIRDTWIKSAGGFLENYIASISGEVRTMEFWNVRAKMKKNGTWENASRVKYSINNSVSDMKYKGSYNFGQDAHSCWIITSGISNLCRTKPQTAEYKVPYTETGRPFD